MPTTKPAKDVEVRLAARRGELRAAYAEEERQAAQEEIRERDERDRKSSVYSVRLSPDVYEAVRSLAEQQHLTPSALIRQWVSERATISDEPDDLHGAVANLRRDIERLSKLVKPA